MSSADQVAVVFTFKSKERICLEGGTQSWRMHQSHFGKFDYVICARNRRREGVEGPEEHGAAFMIGKVRDIVPAIDDDDPKKPRFLIRMTEAAIIHDKPGFWQWGRWPTHYDSLTSLGINPADYDFKPLSELLSDLQKTSDLVDLGFSDVGRQAGGQGWKQSIDQAKASLAHELGVEAAAIEITIRM